MDSPPLITAGDWLAYLLRKARWKHADAADAAGVSTDTISHIVNGVVRAKKGPGRGANTAIKRLLATALSARFEAMVHHPDIRLPPDEAALLQEQTKNLITAGVGPAVARTPSNLPAHLTPCLGRAQEVAQLATLLRQPSVRLFTFTGPGGVGKTRLALEVAARVGSLYPHGVFLVALAAVRAPDVVVPTIARTLGLRETSGQTLAATVVDYLHDKHMVVVLDNFEHVVAAASDVVALLTACPHLSIWVTSRTPLQVRGEHEFPVPPLALPDLHTLPPTEALPQYGAVALFLERVDAVKPGFALTDENAAAIAGICVRVDGLPLALELAAAKIRILSPRALLARLEHRLPVLTGGACDVPERQRTLRSTIAWSMDDVTAEERVLFRRLSVFVGGWTVEAAQTVCARHDGLMDDVLDGLRALVVHSLVQSHDQVNGEPRFVMLETIREYGAEELEAADEAPCIRQRHAAYYCGVAEAAEPGLTGPDQATAIALLHAEHDNLRAALAWIRIAKEADLGLRLAGALWRFWSIRGYLSEGRAWLEEVLALRASRVAGEQVTGTTVVRAKALYAAGALAFTQGEYRCAVALFTASAAIYQEHDDLMGQLVVLTGLGAVAQAQGEYETATQLHGQSLALAEQIGDTRRMAVALNNLGVLAHWQGHDGEATTYQTRCLALYTDMGDQTGIAQTYNNLGLVASGQGDLERAATLYEDGRVLWQHLGDKKNTALALLNLGSVRHKQGNLARASALYQDCLTMFQDLGEISGMAMVLHNAGNVAHDQGDEDGALDGHRQALALNRRLGDQRLAAHSLEGIARVARATGHPDRAARLFGAAAAVRAAIGAPLPPAERPSYDREVTATREALGAEAFAAAWHHGHTLSLDHVLQGNDV